MNCLKTLLCVAATCMVAATLRAQTYNDSVRTHTWSVYMQGGISGHHGVRSPLFDRSKQMIAPDLNLGMKYNIKPWVRVGANIGYTRMNATDKTILSQSSTQSGYPIGDHIGTLEVRSDRLQNRNKADLLGLDVNADFNILDIWHNRKLQWMNLYAGIGVGYMHGWNRNVQTTSFNETGIAQGDGYYNVYTHAYMESDSFRSQFNALYIPLSLSWEFDVHRRLTLGVIGQYKWIPTKADFSPKGIYSVGVVVRYNFVKSKSKVQQERIDYLNRRIEQAKAACAETTAALQRKAEAETEALKRREKELERQLAECQRSNAEKQPAAVDGAGSTAIYFDHNSDKLSPVNTERLRALAEQLKANDQRQIMLIGSANTVGADGVNRRLSDKRVNAVKKALTDAGIDDTRFKSSLSLGAYNMTADPECRRVIVVALE